ncbi:SGNH/GDSL hydrolase family protein [Paraburkholderia sp. GAS334]|uniref:SGNH/GDSL hydrolase family protein n=1 Tax=Paraburkholderia sp. GAS334 TaxID=3035131 RepID=UPI003D1F03BD
MKHNGIGHRGLVRVAQCAIAGAAFALLAACGGGSDNNNASSTPPGGVKLQVVSFGDSLSDVGTYAPVVTASFGGGRFTTNPGEIWTQKVAEYYGDTLTAANQGGFGQPLVATSGLGYAQGGSRVGTQPGIGFASPPLPPYAQLTTVPIVDQVNQYITQHGTFNSNQLVLINGGANDIFYWATVIQKTAAAVQAGTAPPSALAAAQAQATTGMTTAATQFVGAVQLILSKGAAHVVVSDVPDIKLTPEGVQGGATAQGLFDSLVVPYNNALKQYLSNVPQVIYVSAYAWLDQSLANYQSLGFTVSNTDTGCALAKMVQSATTYAQQNPSVLAPGQTASDFGTSFGSSLFCSPQTYTVAGADQTYMFADQVHPSTHLHALFAQTVEQAIAQHGIGK